MLGLSGPSNEIAMAAFCSKLDSMATVIMPTSARKHGYIMRNVDKEDEVRYQSRPNPTPSLRRLVVGDKKGARLINNLRSGITGSPGLRRGGEINGGNHSKMRNRVERQKEGEEMEHGREINGGG